MKFNIITTIVISSLLMSACSQIPQRQSNHQAPTYTPPHTQSTQQRSQVSQLPQYSPISPARNRMINIAKSTLGAPYKWGGNSPQRGFDCSGLMTYVHKSALGVKIPRTAAKQRDQSRTINYTQLKPGDMLFFKTGRKTNHVGVYIGNRQFIHAPSGGKRVTMATMDSSYWHKRFVKFGTFFR